MRPYHGLHAFHARLPGYCRVVNSAIPVFMNDSVQSFLCERVTRKELAIVK